MGDHSDWPEPGPDPDPDPDPGPGIRRIGFYVHHHGTGHLRRTAAVVACLDRPATILTSLDVAEGVFAPEVEVIRLPPDHDPDAPTPVDPTGNGALHWAPLDPDRLQPRAAVMTRWLTSGRAAALVCDVSVEATLLARLCGVGPIVVRQHGNRTDGPHELAHRVAVGLVAPYPEPLEPLDTPDWVRARTHHAGIITSSHPPLDQAAARAALGLDRRPTLLIAVGGGGHSLTPTAVAEAADELGGWNIVAVGTATRERGPGWRCDGWVDATWTYLRAADVVCGAGGSNLVAEVATAGRALICVPEDRPFDEQVVRARRLAQLGAAVVRSRWPRAGEWRRAVEEASALGPERLSALVDPDAAARTARWIAATATASATAARATAVTGAAIRATPAAPTVATGEHGTMGRSRPVHDGVDPGSGERGHDPVGAGSSPFRSSADPSRVETVR